MSTQPPPVFLERRSYRRRRVMDAVRLLPWFGALLFCLPLIWPVGPGEGTTGDLPIPMSIAMIFVFAVWVGLIVLAACLSYALREGERGPDSGEDGRGPAGET